MSRIIIYISTVLLALSCSNEKGYRTVSEVKKKESADQLATARQIIQRFKKGQSDVDVEQLFKARCVACHGIKGNLGINGAGDLSTSGLDLEHRIARIYFGKNTMTPFKDVLSEDEIVELALFVALLRQE